MARSPDAPKTQMDRPSPLSAALAMSARDSSSVSSGKVAAARTLTPADRRTGRREDFANGASNRTPVEASARWLLALKRRFEMDARCAGATPMRATHALTAAMAPF